MITRISSASFTRPANTTAYSAGQVVSNATSGGVAMQFKGAIYMAGQQGTIQKVQLIKSTTALTNATFILYLFSADPGTENDASTGTLTYANAPTLVATVAFPTMTAFGSIAIGEYLPQAGEQSLLSADTSNILYGILQANAAYTPGNAEQFTVRCFIDPVTDQTGG